MELLQKLYMCLENRLFSKPWSHYHWSFLSKLSFTIDRNDHAVPWQFLGYKCCPSLTFFHTNFYPRKKEKIGKTRTMHKNSSFAQWLLLNPRWKDELSLRPLSPFVSASHSFFVFLSRIRFYHDRCFENWSIMWHNMVRVALSFLLGNRESSCL